MICFLCIADEAGMLIALSKASRNVANERNDNGEQGEKKKSLTVTGEKKERLAGGKKERASQNATKEDVTMMVIHKFGYLPCTDIV